MRLEKWIWFLRKLEKILCSSQKSPESKGEPGFPSGSKLDCRAGMDLHSPEQHPDHDVQPIQSGSDLWLLEGGEPCDHFHQTHGHRKVLCKVCNRYLSFSEGTWSLNLWHTKQKSFFSQNSLKETFSHFVQWQREVPCFLILNKPRCEPIGTSSQSTACHPCTLFHFLCSRPAIWYNTVVERAVWDTLTSLGAVEEKAKKPQVLLSAFGSCIYPLPASWAHGWLCSSLINVLAADLCPAWPCTFLIAMDLCGNLDSWLNLGDHLCLCASVLYLS